MKKKGFPIIRPSEIQERMREDRLVSILPQKVSFDSRYAKSQNLELEERVFLPEGYPEEFVKEIHCFPFGEWNLETSENQIKIDCPKCGCDKKNIRYQSSGDVVSLRCPACGIKVDDSAVKDGRFDDIFKYWNWMSYMSKELDIKVWERKK